ncbi:ABC transporter ATP-binding protein [Aureibacillus halotolerans]|uniref:Spermidine/putrescine import ATP-binding protein PotA n=1 Tax=Aureibacillus halotolerans TaxID=1508390 RepID=A0A4R6UDP6_9BACI|nr:ABC transporter ATP-binding protein [Aureibacillus halotolerans]TDQ42925.1 putative spermidine/putrescine transport system ATP-binding protein [Aureibacillus halotolerans]
MTKGISIRGVSRQFGENTALRHVDLEVREGEFFSLLGPSGCGKTTLLNIIAGFLDPSSGDVYLDETDVTALPPFRRKMGMVFQNYALFPHLSVFDNVAYGLRVKKMPKADIAKKVEEVLALVRLEAYADRMPQQLSGGQQQRVAIARAMAIEPSVLLLDEPLSNLDAKLRKDMQTELRRIQRSIGITTILVTHDQEEALSLSDRIGILGDGELQQVGEPMQVYRQPANRFVAEFIGQVNILEGRKNNARSGDDVFHYDVSTHANETGGLHIAVPNEPALDQEADVQCMLRPERITIGAKPVTPGINHVTGVLKDVSYAGELLRLRFELKGRGELIVHATDPNFPTLPKAGEEMELSWRNEDIIPLVQRGDATWQNQ